MVLMRKEMTFFLALACLIANSLLLKWTITNVDDYRQFKLALKATVILFLKGGISTVEVPVNQHSIASEKYLYALYILEYMYSTALRQRHVTKLLPDNMPKLVRQKG